MIDPERLAAFALMTAATSIVPGMSMVFVMAQTIQRGARNGAAALAGLQIGYLVWWTLAALGLGSLAAAHPQVFTALAIAGALYLAWLGVSGIRHAGAAAVSDVSSGRAGASPHALRSGIAVALGNPKSLVYMVAMLPPFIDPARPVVPQLALMAAVSLVLDVLIGALYIATGSRLSAVMTRSAVRQRADIAVGALYLAIAAGLLIDVAAG